MAAIQIDGRPLLLPRMIDKRPDGTFCARADGDGGYAENFEGYLQMNCSGWEDVYFDYSFEDGTLLSDSLAEDRPCPDCNFMEQKGMLLLLQKIGVKADENGVPLKDLLAALE